MKDQRSPTEDDEPWWALGLTPKPGGNPPDIPPHFLYDPEDDVYWNPLRPSWMRPRTTPPVIDRRVLPDGEVEEWERPATIPDDFIYDPETHSYYPPGEPSMFDAEAFMREFREEMDNRSEEERRKGLITVDQLRAAGALDFPAAWRKSLGGGERDLFSDLVDDDAPSSEKQQPPRTDADSDKAADELP